VFKLDASVCGFELPVGFGVFFVPLVFPCFDFLDKDLFGGDAAARDWDDRTQSSDSAMSSHDPCWGG
jgi:hypothetical protein